MLIKLCLPENSSKVREATATALALHNTLAVQYNQLRHASCIVKKNNTKLQLKHHTSVVQHVQYHTLYNRSVVQRSENNQVA